MTALERSRSAELSPEAATLSALALAGKVGLDSFSASGNSIAFPYRVVPSCAILTAVDLLSLDVERSHW